MESKLGMWYASSLNHFYLDKGSIVNDRMSIAKLLGIVTLAGLYAGVFRMAVNGSVWATIVAGCGLVALAPFLLFAIAFLIVYPFGILNEIMEKGSEQAASPFAQDRLPSQYVTPQADPEKAH